MADLKETLRKLIGSECLYAVRTLKGGWDVVTSWRRTVAQNRLVGSIRACESQPSVQQIA
jgi:hypothetical protein